MKDLLQWGHSLADFQNMFCLTAQELHGNILDIGSGPASFNAEVTKRGGKVISVDTLFSSTYEQVQRKINDEFPHFHFDLALCSHFLFSYQENQDLDFHFKILDLLSHIAQEVRIFPLFNSHGELPQLLGPLLHLLTEKNIGIEIKAASSPSQQKENAMLKVWAQSCEVL